MSTSAVWALDIQLSAEKVAQVLPEEAACVLSTDLWLLPDNQSLSTDGVVIVTICCSFALRVCMLILGPLVIVVRSSQCHWLSSTWETEAGGSHV